jgi:sugar phosphate isomerase/epimerase
MKWNYKLGIQSYCFRKYQNISELIDALKKASLSFVEIWPGHIDFEEDTIEQEAKINQIQNAGITIDAYGSAKFSEDYDQSEKVFKLASKMNIKNITSSPPEKTFPVLEQLSEKYDINIAIHNHGPNSLYSTMSDLEKALQKTSPRIGVCLDTAWLLASGEDPVTALERFQSRIYGVHLKDFQFDQDGNPSDVIIGEGTLDLVKLIQKLADMVFTGYMSIEYEGDMENPIPNTLRCVEAVKDAVNQL